MHHSVVFNPQMNNWVNNTDFIIPTNDRTKHSKGFEKSNN